MNKKKEKSDDESRGSFEPLKRKNDDYDWKRDNGKSEKCWKSRESKKRNEKLKKKEGYSKKKMRRRGREESGKDKIMRKLRGRKKK